MTRRVFALVAAGAVALGAAPARAYVPDLTPKRRLEADVRRMFALPPVRPSLPGVLVLRAGRPIIAVNADRPMVPASLLKLATTTAAVVRWGPDHRIATRVVGNAPRGGVTGTTWLVGGGDPTLATAAFRDENFFPKPDDPIPIPVFHSGSPTVEQLAAAVAQAGVRRIAGDLLVDDTRFDRVFTQQGWIRRYLGPDPDTGYLSALTVNEGFGDLKRKSIVPDPSIAAGLALKAALAARGIVVTGTVHRSRAPAAAAEIARVESPPLSEIVGYANRFSVNYAAELLLKGLGASFRGAGTTAAGVAVVRETLASLKIPLEGLVMWDGSGLSLDDRVTPRTLGAILQWMLTDQGPAAATVRDSLPVAGGQGTLYKRMTRPPTVGNLRGKTGNVRHVRGMAGWVTAADGVPLVYVALFNSVPSPGALTAPLNFLGLALALFAGA
jgi:D-alanyl-D-alanine carboxypeptidase/D-alanyl-D-alanine-endopeptidase (penicillin-binding protein 4)